MAKCDQRRCENEATHAFEYTTPRLAAPYEQKQIVHVCEAHYEQARRNARAQSMPNVPPAVPPSRLPKPEPPPPPELELEENPAELEEPTAAPSELPPTEPPPGENDDADSETTS
jgi:hypothetical protein